MVGWLVVLGFLIGIFDCECFNFGGVFGSLFFNFMGGDFQFFGLGNLGNVFGLVSVGVIGIGSIGCGSKMGFFFLVVMQVQMYVNDLEGVNFDMVFDLC